MRRSSGVAIAVVVGSVAVVAPIWISVQLAWNEAVANQQSRVQSYAADLVQRSEEAATRINDAARILNAAHYPSCDPQEVALMQELAVTSNYIQAIGRINGNQLSCTSLGTMNPVELGPADLITENGAEERLNVWIFKAQNHPLLVVSRDGFAYLLDSSFLEDLPPSGDGISVGLFVPSQPRRNLISAFKGSIPSNWLRDIPKGTSATFTEGGYIVSIVRSQQSDIAAVAATPSVYIHRRVWPLAFIYIPLGLICAGCLVWAVTQISRSRLSLTSAIRRAAKRKEFFVEYQPIVNLATGRWIGAEALVRWRHNGKLVMPDSFIPAAEESGVITLITACVGEIIAADLPSLLNIDPQFHISINLSGPDLVNTETVDLLNFIMAAGRARPENIQIEATERRFLQGDLSRWMISAIRSLGIAVALDDFGTGYSSLSCVQTLGIDALKIDKSFVETIGTDGATSQVVPHIIDMAHSLELVMVAEGVETEAQAAFLRKRGVHFAQGWLFAKAMNVSALRDTLRKQHAVCESAALAYKA